MRSWIELLELTFTERGRYAATECTKTTDLQASRMELEGLNGGVLADPWPALGPVLKGKLGHVNPLIAKSSSVPS